MEVKHEFLAPKTLKQNGVAERKNGTLLDMATFMLMNKDLAKRFWAEAIRTAFYVSKCVYCRPGTNKTAYELWIGKKSNVKYFKVIDSTCYILGDRKHLGKFNKKSNDVIFLGYSNTSIAYRVYNKRSLTMEESINVGVDDSESTQTQVDIHVVFSDYEVKTSTRPRGDLISI